MRIKKHQGEESGLFAFLRFYAFCAFFTFCAFCAFCVFLRVKYLRKKK